MSHRASVTLGIVLASLAAVLALLAPRFFQPQNLVDVFLATLPVLIVSFGALMVMLIGEIDISVGSLFAVSSVVAGVLAVAGWPMPVVAALTLCVGALAGAANGALTAYVRIPSIVVTLASLVILRDGLRWVTEGAWVQNLPRAFQWFGLSQQLFPWLAAAVAALLAAGLSGFLRHTRAGRSIYATGSHPEAARLAAINTRLVTTMVFAAGGLLTALAAVVNAVRFNQIPSNTGLGLEMKVIAAVVVGGTSITGGRGSVMGTILGVVLLGVSGPALTFLGASPYWERALQGAIILAAVGADALGRRRTGSVRAPEDRRDVA